MFEVNLGTIDYDYEPYYSYGAIVFLPFKQRNRTNRLSQRDNLFLNYFPFF